MSERFSHIIPPEYEEMKKTLQDAIRPVLQQQEQFRDLFNVASLSLPKVYDYKTELSGITNVFLQNSKGLDDSFVELEKKIQTSLGQWILGNKEIFEEAKKLEEGFQYAKQRLLAEDSPLIVWGKFGWTISPGAQVKHFYYVPDSKEDADKYMNEIHNEKIQRKTIQLLRNCPFHSLKDIEEVEALYINGYYKSCALLMFSLIESLLLHTEQESEHPSRLKTGKNAIKYYEKMAKPEDCLKLAVQVLCFRASTEALNAFFADGDNLQNHNPVLNRNLCCHGVFWRDVNKTDCSQLILLYENMLLCIGMI